MNGIGENLRYWRKKRGLSQEALAVKCGWEGNGRVSNYEKGLREPTLADITLMATSLGISSRDLLADPVPPNEPDAMATNEQPAAVYYQPAGHHDAADTIKQVARLLSSVPGKDREAAGVLLASLAKTPESDGMIAAITSFIDKTTENR